MLGIKNMCFLLLAVTIPFYSLGASLDGRVQLGDVQVEGVGRRVLRRGDHGITRDLKGGKGQGKSKAPMGKGGKKDPKVSKAPNGKGGKKSPKETKAPKAPKKAKSKGPKKTKAPKGPRISSRVKRQRQAERKADRLKKRARAEDREKKRSGEVVGETKMMMMKDDEKKSMRDRMERASGSDIKKMMMMTS